MVNKLIIATFSSLFILSANASADIKVTNAYTKEVPPNSPTIAVYFTVANDDDVFDKLIGAESKIAEAAEIHEHVFADGMMKMQKINEAIIPVGRTQFKPKSHHLMLINLKEPIKTGDTFPVTLEFATFGKLDINVTVK